MSTQKWLMPTGDYYFLHPSNATKTMGAQGQLKDFGESLFRCLRLLASLHSPDAVNDIFISRSKNLDFDLAHLSYRILSMAQTLGRDRVVPGYRPNGQSSRTNVTRIRQYDNRCAQSCADIYCLPGLSMFMHEVYFLFCFFASAIDPCYSSGSYASVRSPSINSGSTNQT